MQYLSIKDCKHRQISLHHYDQFKAKMAPFFFENHQTYSMQILNLMSYLICRVHYLIILRVLKIFFISYHRYLFSRFLRPQDLLLTLLDLGACPCFSQQNRYLQMSHFFDLSRFTSVYLHILDLGDYLHHCQSFRIVKFFKIYYLLTLDAFRFFC